MGVIGIILLIVFVIICILLVGIVLIQRESGDGLGGLFGSGNSAAFGSRSQTVITKTTYVLVALFFLTTFVQVHELFLSFLLSQLLGAVAFAQAAPCSL